MSIEFFESGGSKLRVRYKSVEDTFTSLNLQSFLGTEDAQRILEGAPDCYLVLSADFTIVAVSDAYAVATHTKRESIVGRHIFDVFPDNPDDPTADGVRSLRASLERVLCLGQPESMPLLRYDVRRSPEAGGAFEARFWSPHNSPVFDQNGAVRYIIHRASDITASVSLAISGSEATAGADVMSGFDMDRFNEALGNTSDKNEALLTFALRQSDRNVLSLAEAVPAIVWSADTTGAIDWFNQLWYTHTAQQRDAALGWGWQAVIHPDDLSDAVRGWVDAVKHETNFEAEFRIRRSDGEFRWFLTRAQPTRGIGNDVIRWFGTCVDIEMQRRALERSERIADTLQQVFLPSTLPHRPNLSIDATYSAADRQALIGGDWYDAVEMPDGRLMFSIGDVTGHGLEASVSAGRIRQAIYTIAFAETDPAAVLRAVNRTVFHSAQPIATAIVGFVDKDNAKVTYACAGHPPPVIGNRDGSRSIQHGGFPLGVLADFETESFAIDIAPNDVLVLYTDGLTEFARDALAGEGQVCRAVTAIAGSRTVAHPAENIYREVVGTASNVDDIAILVLQFSSVDLAAVQRENPKLRKIWRFNSRDAHTASSSRRELISYLESFAADRTQLFESELILGEILANTVEHAPGLVTVDIDWSGAKPVVTVCDTGPGLARLDSSLPSDPYNERGRGMFLIRSLAENVELSRSAGYGTELRATLPIVRDHRL